MPDDVPDTGPDPAPRYEPDPLLLMDLAATHARDARRGSDDRADAQRRWRAAFFQAIRKGLIRP